MDDASTDDTPDVIQAKAAQYPGQVFHLRRDKGGEGKAHTLNHGLADILDDDWMQALLIMDADVIYEPESLRHDDPASGRRRVGAVSAYIREGSRPGNYLTRFIGFEYITAQAAARRSQNVLGAVACLAGGAQLHSRDNLQAIGGQIDTSLARRRHLHHVRDPAAGPRGGVRAARHRAGRGARRIGGLWKQRLRWARGNVQVTKQFKHVWSGRAPPTGWAASASRCSGSALFLLPVFMILASASLITLYFSDFAMAWIVFHVLWIVNALTYVFITSFVLMIDWVTGRHAWIEGILFPGAISLSIIVAACFPRLLRMIFYGLLPMMGIVLTPAERRVLVLFAYAWLAGSMLVAYLGKAIEPRRYGRVPAAVSSTSRATGRCCARARSRPTSRNCGTPR